MDVTLAKTIIACLVTNEENAYESARFVRDTHFEMWDEDIEIDFDELDKQFNIYSF